MSPCCRFHLCALLSWVLLETYLFLSSFIVSTLLKCPHSGEICLIWMIFYVHLCVQENNHLDHFSTRRKGLSFAKDIISVGKINFSIDGWFGNAKQSQLVFRNLEQCEKTSKGIECTETLTTSFCVCFQLNEMIRAPVEGDFWQVDHIRPVYSGGGQCSLDNLQTLCTVCHKAVCAHSASLHP